MSTSIEIFKLLEASNEKKIAKGLALLKENPDLKPEIEARYLNFIKARLNNPKASIFDFGQAALSKKEIAIFNDKDYVDTYCISLHYMDDAETKMIVDTIGSVFALLVDIEAIKKKFELLPEEDFYNKIYDLYHTEIPSIVTTFHKKHKNTYGWYGKIIKKISKLNQISKFYLDHTTFLSASDSLMMEHFTFGLLAMNRSSSSIHIDIAQSNFPKFYPIFWAFPRHAAHRISVLDEEVVLPASFLSFVREVDVREDDFKAYQKVRSQFITPVITPDWLEERPRIQALFQDIGIGNFADLDLDVQKKIIIELLETADFEEFKLGLTLMDKQDNLLELVYDYYKDLLKAHKSSKYIHQLFGPISNLIKGNLEVDKPFGAKEHSTMDVKYLNALPDSLLERMSYLSLDKNLLNRLTIPLEKFKQIEYLIMEAAKFNNKAIPKVLADWVRLKEVQITKAKLTEIPTWIENWSSLNKLSFVGNMLTDLPKEIAYLKHLEDLQLDSNKFTIFPEAITQVKQLKKLDLSNNKFADIPNSIGELQELTHLRLVKCKKLKDISSIYQLQNLEELQLEFSGVSEVSAEIANLKSLKKLDLEQGKFKSLPKEIGLLSELEELHINGCKGLKILPEEIEKLEKLKILNLATNEFSDFVNSLTKLPTGLETLYLYDCKLTEVPIEITRFKMLKQLNLYNNKLISLLPEIGELIALEKLYLSDNQLDILPKGIGGLVKLNTLYVMNNQLKEVPAEIGSLTQLEELALRDNQLTALPKEIGNLVHLKNLYLQNNQLEDLPEEIKELTQLKKIYLRDNPITKDKKKMNRIRKLVPESCWVSG